MAGFGQEVPDMWEVIHDNWLVTLRWIMFYHDKMINVLLCLYLFLPRKYTGSISSATTVAPRHDANKWKVMFVLNKIKLLFKSVYYVSIWIFDGISTMYDNNFLTSRVIKGPPLSPWHDSSPDPEAQIIWELMSSLPYIVFWVHSALLLKL